MNRLTRNNRTAPTAAESTASTTASTTVSRRFRIAGPAWQAPREREFGTGYGNSSGYASAKRYTNDWGLTRFRCA